MASNKSANRQSTIIGASLCRPGEPPRPSGYRQPPAPTASTARASNRPSPNFLRRSRRFRRRMTRTRSIFGNLATYLVEEYSKWSPKARPLHISEPFDLRKSNPAELVAAMHPLRLHPLAPEVAHRTSGSRKVILPGGPVGSDKGDEETASLGTQLRELELASEAKIAGLEATHVNKEHALRMQQKISADAWKATLMAECKKVSALEQRVKDLEAQILELENIQAEASHHPYRRMVPTFVEELSGSSSNGGVIRDRDELFFSAPRKPERTGLIPEALRIHRPPLRGHLPPGSGIRPGPRGVVPEIRVTRATPPAPISPIYELECPLDPRPHRSSHSVAPVEPVDRFCATAESSNQHQPSGSISSPAGNDEREGIKLTRTHTSPLPSSHIRHPLNRPTVGGSLRAGDANSRSFSQPSPRSSAVRPLLPRASRALDFMQEEGEIWKS